MIKISLFSSILCIPGTSTQCYLRITGLHFLLCLEKQHKLIEKPETVRGSAWAQGLKLICLLMVGHTTGCRGPGESQAVSLKASLDKIAVQAATSSAWGGPMNIQCCAACLPSPGVVGDATACRKGWKEEAVFSLDLGLLRNLMEGKAHYFCIEHMDMKH